MTDRQPSGEATALLETLYEEYEGFDVTQTTVSVDPEEFDAIDAGDVVEVRVRIEGSDGLLAVPADGEWERPGGVVPVDGERSLSSAGEELVRQQTGVDCHIEELCRVSLVCLQSEASGEKRWRVSALFSATVESGTPTAGAAWRESLPESSAAF